MKIESIRLKNDKVFRDVHLTDIPSFLVVVGANGSGKSTLFDVFGFLPYARAARATLCSLLFGGGFCAQPEGELAAA